MFAVDYIEDLRQRFDNQFIYAEQCDLSDLYSVRRFATKYIDNSPPRRLDMVICCAGLMAPPYTARTTTKDGIEAHLGINYLAHFHLLNLLAPVMKVQPADRDVRVLLATCTSHILGELDLNDLQFLRRKYPMKAPWRSYGAAKLALMIFGVEFQRRLSAYKRPDGEAMNVRVFSIDPGLARTPGARRWLSLGTLWGLALYLITWPVWWLVLKSSASAAQTFLTAAMSPECAEGEGGKFLKECKNQPYVLCYARETSMLTALIGTADKKLPTRNLGNPSGRSLKRPFKASRRSQLRGERWKRRTTPGRSRQTTRNKTRS